MNELIKDLCRVFLDELINLRPIAHLSSLCMCRRNYQDFLSPPMGDESSFKFNAGTYLSQSTITPAKVQSQMNTTRK